MSTAKDKIWLSSPHMGGTERNYVEQAFATNWVAPLGPNVDEFEKAYVLSRVLVMLLRLHQVQEPYTLH
jgi:dTDP-4-amino-4,6-dideoxygalactose transaminase